jgi:death-on-curing protein
VTRYLTILQILFLHARLIEETGGGHGLRDLGLLESAAARPQATFSGQELYPDLFTKAAALMASLVNNHPFLDGNKRTGITAASLFLLQNGFRLETTQAELERFTLRVASSAVEIAEIAAWFQQHSRQVV